MIWFCYGILFKYDLINLDYEEYRFNMWYIRYRDDKILYWKLMNCMRMVVIFLVNRLIRSDFFVYL